MWVAVACLAILVQPFARAMPGRNRDKEENLVAKIAREKNPGKKARLQIQLAKLNLVNAGAVYDRQGYDEGKALLQQYLAQVKASWATLQGADNAIRKHLRAFKDLEIALREDDRILEDLRHRVPYPESEVIREIAKESNLVHSQVLEALFPDGFPRKEKSRRSLPPGSSVAGKAGAARS
jgi:hypothetical protein